MQDLNPTHIPLQKGLKLQQGIKTSKVDPIHY